MQSTIVGTPQYMPPEQTEGKKVDERADQYSLGCMLYEMLTGSVPFDHKNVVEVLLMQRSAPPQPPRQRVPGLAIPDSLEKLVLKLLSKQPAQRFASMQELADALDYESQRLERRLSGQHSISTLNLRSLFSLPPPEQRVTTLVVHGWAVPLWLVALVAAVLAIAGTLGYHMLRERSVAARPALPEGASSPVATVTPPASPSLPGPAGADPAAGSVANKPALAGASVAAAPPVPSQPAAPGGTVRVTTPSGDAIQVQIDDRPWQLAGTEPLPLPAGHHKLVTLAATRDFDVRVGEALVVSVPESKLEQALRQGVTALLQQDYGKAQQKLEKAASLGQKKCPQPTPCAALALELAVRLGQTYEAQDNLPKAMSAYEQALGLSAQMKVRPEWSGSISTAMARLVPKLGRVVLYKSHKGSCQEHVSWAPPGRFLVQADGKSQQVSIRAGETLTLGTCRP